MFNLEKQWHSLIKQASTRLKTADQALHWRPRVTTFILVAALFNAILYHRPLYQFAIANLDYSTHGGLLTLATVFFLLVFITTVILALLSLISQHLIKPICILAAPCNALALYFIETYGVVLDKSMMGNVFNTDFAEASSYYSPRLLVYLLVLGVVPCWFLLRVHVQKTRFLQRAAFLFLVLFVGGGWIYAGSKTWLWFDKNASKLGGRMMPWSYVINASRYHVAHLMASRTQTLLPPARFVGNEKTIVFLVIGESARAKNFSLYGYPRLTNPLLAHSGIVALPGSRACATYTTAAVLCILSPVDTGWQLSSSYEPLPNYLQRQGIDVIWRANNWGSPPLKVQTYERSEDLQKGCTGDSCNYDEVLLSALEQRIRSSTKNKIFVVLHQSGSHGPSYYTKYPKQFEVFKPACQSVDLHQCSNAELVNAYDNTILYTDDFLYRAIGLLKNFQNTATMLMYLSDHGESLGEHGLYLHGTPYSIAPDVQKDIPFLVWMSDTFKQKNGAPIAPLVRQTSYSQANVFHSVMGAFDMRSEIYNHQLDIFSRDTQ
ncbi:MAG: phosphoethanolamine--lipid A transferase EptA [bacterium]|nr:phosphoethanolamine--lipid A transferase EptA [bacterium]